MLQFSLEQTQVDIGRTFTGAGAASETVSQGKFQLIRNQRITFRAALFQRGADEVRSAAGGHAFLTGREVGGTHGRRLLGAAAAAVALFEIGDEGFIAGGKASCGTNGSSSSFSHALTQIAVNLVTPIAYDFARIEKIVRVEGA
jgi:hypothetical protein